METSIVVPQFIGRLGNNLFQIAAAIGYAHKYKCRWAVPGVSNEVPNLHKFFPGMPIDDGNYLRRYNRADPSQFNYEPIPFHPNGAKLVGFWQSTKWFEGADDEIRKLFTLDIKPIEAVSIHVRRTDYIGNPNTPTITKEYIQKAFELLKTKIDVYNIDVFSDDIAWCREHVISWVQGNRGGSNWVFHDPSKENEFEALSRMASCTHNIIANSTFSWWGAWLNPNPDKIVISPSVQNWFGPNFGGGPPKDIIPDNWIQIKY